MWTVNKLQFKSDKIDENRTFAIIVYMVLLRIAGKTQIFIIFPKLYRATSWIVENKIINCTNITFLNKSAYTDRKVFNV